MERFNVQLPTHRVAVPTIAILALDRLGVHLLVDVERLDVLQNDRVHHAFRTGVRNQVHMDGQMFQQCLCRTL